MSELGERIRALRRQAKMTQDDLAERIGANRVTIANYELGKYAPSVDALERLADALGTEPDVITGRAEKPAAPRPVTDEDIKFALFGGADGVTEEDYEDVKRYAAFVKARKNGGSL